MQIPKFIAHRGYMRVYPENTRLALSEAIRCGAWGVEFDVQCTQDGTLVVMHDDTLDRITDATGSLFELNWAQLQQVSAHEPTRFGERFLGEPISSLAQIMLMLAQSPAVRALVEIKEASLERFGRDTLMSLLCRELKPYQRQCTLISFDAAAIAYAKMHAFHTGWVLNAVDAVSLEQALELKPDLLIGDYQRFKSSEVPWAGPWDWMLYDIVDPLLALDFAQRGVKLIETADVGRMLEHPTLRRRRLGTA